MNTKYYNQAFFIAVFALVITSCKDWNPPTNSTQTQSGGQQNQTSTSAPTKAQVLPEATISLTRNFYVIFDDSGSMKRWYSNETRRIEAAKAAARGFLNNVSNDANIGLYLLNQSEVVALGQKTDKQKYAFIDAIDNVEALGDTPLGQAIAFGAAKLAKQRDKQLGYGEFRLIVITDGESSDDLNRGVKAALKEKIPIYTIGVATGKHSLAKSSVSFVEANNPAELQKAMLETLAELPDFSDADFKK